MLKLHSFAPGTACTDFLALGSSYCSWPKCYVPLAKPCLPQLQTLDLAHIGTAESQRRALEHSIFSPLLQGLFNWVQLQ